MNLGAQHFFNSTTVPRTAGLHVGADRVMFQLLNATAVCPHFCN